MLDFASYHEKHRLSKTKRHLLPIGWPSSANVRLVRRCRAWRVDLGMCRVDLGEAIINQDNNCHQNFAFDFQPSLISKMTKIF